MSHFPDISELLKFHIGLAPYFWRGGLNGIVTKQRGGSISLGFPGAPLPDTLPRNMARCDVTKRAFAVLWLIVEEYVSTKRPQELGLVGTAEE